MTAYNIDELAVLLSAATADERLLFEFFLGTGFRETEVMYCTWSNVDLKSKVVSVWSKPEMAFRVKDKEERSVPIPDSLITVLADRKKRSTSMLVFPSESGKPNGHFLRLLKELAFHASLNCGECKTKTGQSCGTHPVCSNWTSHKFRRTFATMHSEADASMSGLGVSVHATRQSLVSFFQVLGGVECDQRIRRDKCRTVGVWEVDEGQ